nr:lmo0937 family membrane protein [Verrucomicrobium spinosum]
MLYTIAVILIIAWLLGLVTSYTLSGFIHILLVVAIVIVLLRVIQAAARYDFFRLITAPLRKPLVLPS